MPCNIGVIWAEKERKRMGRIQKILKTEDCNEKPQVLLNIFILLNICDVVELDLIGNDDVDGHNHLVISD